MIVERFVSNVNNMDSGFHWKVLLCWPKASERDHWANYRGACNEGEA